MAMLTCKRGRFSLPPGVTYLNCAYMSPMMKKVEQAGVRAVRKGRNPTATEPQDFFTDSETLRGLFGRLIHADSHRIAIIPSVSYGLANAAANIAISRNEEVVVAADQFPSNYYVWQRLCEDKGGTLRVVKPDDTLEARGRKWNERILEAINPRTRVVAIAHTHWADGTRFDLEAIRKRTRDVNALLIVDGSQSVGALPFDVQTLQPDALICTGYKWLLGPYSIGLAYYGPAFDDGRPVEENWINRRHSEDFRALVNYQDEYQPGALRYDVGEHSHFILMPMLIQALAQIERWGVSHIQAYCAALTREAAEKIRATGCWVEDETFRGGHIMGIRLRAGMDTSRVKEALQAKQVFVSFRGNAIRVSPHLYNTTADMDRLVKVLSDLA